MAIDGSTRGAVSVCANGQGHDGGGAGITSPPRPRFPEGEGRLVVAPSSTGGGLLLLEHEPQARRKVGKVNVNVGVVRCCAGPKGRK